MFLNFGEDTTVSFASSMMSVSGKRAFRMRRSRRVTDCGAYGSENVGMSNRNVGESPTHRKSEVSWAMVIIPGLVGPKARLKSVVDGHQVNIPELFVYSKERRISVLLAPYWIGVWSLRKSYRQIRMTLFQWRLTTSVAIQIKRRERGARKIF